MQSIHYYSLLFIRVLSVAPASRRGPAAPRGGTPRGGGPPAPRRGAPRGERRREVALGVQYLCYVFFEKMTRVLLQGSENHSCLSFWGHILSWNLRVHSLMPSNVFGVCSVVFRTHFNVVLDLSHNVYRLPSCSHEKKT